MSSLPLSGALAADFSTSADSPLRDHGTLGLDTDGHPEDAVFAQANNSSQHHDNPENVSAEGDLLGVRDWLSNRMLDRLSTGAVELNQGEYERARSLLGDEYDSRLAQFVDVIGETDSESDDDSDDPFQRAQRSQRNLTDRVQNYEETYDDYEEAVAAGDEVAAREHARDLQQIASDVQRLNGTVTRQYGALENQTGTDLTPATRSIENVTENVTERQQRVDERLFTGTELAVAPDSATISYTDPLRATGRLTTESGEPVADRDIRLRIANRTHTVETDGDGRFQVTYRPRTIRTNRSTIRVRYAPENTSEYLASNDSVAVDIEQVTATLSVADTTDEATFGDRLGATARLTIDGGAVDGIPVRAAVESMELGTTITDESGTVTVGGPLPADVPDGDRSLTLSAGAPNTAVTADPISRPVTIRSTATNLTVTAAQTAGDTIAIDGTLATIDGLAVSGQPVEIAVGDAVTETVRTGPNGSYAGTVDGGQLSVTGNTTVTVQAAFDGTGTNLDGAEVTTTATYRDQAAAGIGQPSGIFGVIPSDTLLDDVPPAALAGLAALVGLLVVLLVLRRRYAGGSDDSIDTDSGTETAGDGEAAGDDFAAEATADVVAGNGDASPTESGLDFAPAESLLATGDRAAAVRYAYQHFRSNMAADVGATDSDTHWEFFERCRADGMNGARLDAVRDLVEAYETVEFGPQAAEPDAEALIATVDAQWGSVQNE